MDQGWSSPDAKAVSVGCTPLTTGAGGELTLIASGPTGALGVLGVFVAAEPPPPQDVLNSKVNMAAPSLMLEIVVIAQAPR
jgi:hypothetical protein